LGGHQAPLIQLRPPQVPGGDVVLALSLGESHQLLAAGGDEMTDVRGERRGHRGHQRGGGEAVAPVPDEERGDPGAVLQPRLVPMQTVMVPEFAVPRSANCNSLAPSVRPPAVPVAVAARSVPLKWSFSLNPSDLK